MQIIAVDTNEQSLFELVACLEMAYPDSSIAPFSDPMSAVKFGFNNKIDMIFTEIPMRGVDGFQLVRLIDKHNEDMDICFVTSTMDFMSEALQMQADGYLQKPITANKIIDWIKARLN